MASEPVLPELSCTIGGLAHGGAGVARVDGRVVFVDGALPGETVRAEVTDASRESFWRARVTEVLDPSPDRTPVSCRAAAAGAGCCDLAYGTPEQIRRAKATIVTDALTRIGRVTPAEPVVVEPIAGGETGHGWRGRARPGVGGGDGEPAVIGFRAGHSNRIVAASCAALTPELSAALASVDPALLRPGAEILAVHDDDGAVHLVQTGAAERARGPRPTRAAAQRRRARRALDRESQILIGGPTATFRIGRRAWELPIDAFWQAHRGAAETYAQAVGQWLAPWLPGACVWDLYGGAGVFTGAALDGGAATVHLVDTAGPSLAAAGVVFGDDPVQTHRAAITPAVLAELPAPDLVVLDPPRSGAGRAVLEAVIAAGPAAIVHVGCDPAAFARDVGTAVAAGYHLVRLRAFDAFPLTHHVEAMALLVRTESRRRLDPFASPR